MSNERNPLGVAPGQVWQDNDPRLEKERKFEIVSVDEGYYPKGRVHCKLLGEIGKGQREFFWLKLDRFNGTRRGYSKVESAGSGKSAASRPAKKGGAK